MYKYEFTNIFDLNKVAYRVKNYLAIGTTTIEIFVNDLLLDKRSFSPYMREHYDKVQKTKNPKIKEEIIIPLYPADVETTFSYLLECPSYIHYKIICSVEINSIMDIEELNELDTKIVISI